MTRYRTAAGSTIEVSGKHNGIVDIVFDWFEEGACCKAHPVAEPSDGILTWTCGCCEPGSALLMRVD